VRLSRYILRAKSALGDSIEFMERLTIEQALDRVRELQAAHFSHITIINTLNGLEISDVEALLQERRDADRA
jgi:hypothetical protein